MPRFVKKPIVVEAVQYDGSTEPDKVPEGVCFGVSAMCPKELHVHTVSGDPVLIHKGDWLIREHGGKGTYPCDPAIFELTYDQYVEPIPPAAK